MSRPLRGAAARDRLPTQSEWINSGARSDRSARMALLEHRTGTTRAMLLLAPKKPLREEQHEQLCADLERYQRGEPLAYIIGTQAFHDIELAADARALAPRPETERLVEATLAALRHRAQSAVTRTGPLRCADLGTGSGAIALALLAAWDQDTPLRVTATERCPQACALAQENIDRASASIELLTGDWYAPLAGRQFDVLVSNPPYLSATDSHLPALTAEPRSALVAGEDGLADLHALIDAAPSHLLPAGVLLLEHGAEQGAAVRARYEAAGFEAVHTARDYAGHDRITSGTLCLR
ncbi:MAG: peptide chain release factor N(5)-glutamine methyltransferase [Pseudomonadota bacterium]